MNSKLGWIAGVAALGSAVAPGAACDLCAINSATTARAEATGFVFSLASQYINSHTLQFESQEFKVPNQEFLETSITHVVPGFNFNRDLGVSLNVPIVRKDFRLYDPGAVVPRDEKSEGIGDLSLIARWTPFSLQKMTHGFRVNLLAGVKLPSGDTRYLRQDVAQNTALGLGHNHAFSGVHLHDVTLGTGSVDGVFGVTTYSRWKRFMATTEAQYYLRTEALGFRFGDTVMLSGGPGFYLVTKPNFTLNLQAVGRFENTESSYYGAKIDTETGMREIYIGPQMTVTVGQHFSAQAGGDIPLDMRNRGLQVTPDYRVHASVSWSF
jgi:hypothetical protein